MNGRFAAVCVSFSNFLNKRDEVLVKYSKLIYFSSAIHRDVKHEFSIINECRFYKDLNKTFLVTYKKGGLFF